MVFPQFLKSVQLVTTESVQMKGIGMERREEKGGKGQPESKEGRKTSTEER